MDLSSGFDFPNPYGLLASDFGYDMDGYESALRFLSDLAGGSPEDEALTANGGSRAMLVRWRGIGKFRRVYLKCQQAGEEARAQQALRDAEKAQEGAEDESASQPTGTVFIPLAEAPVVGGMFGHAPAPEMWGE